MEIHINLLKGISQGQSSCHKMNINVSRSCGMKHCSTSISWEHHLKEDLWEKMANSCQHTAGAAGSLGAMGDALKDGRAVPHQPGLVPEPQPGAALASVGRGLSWLQPNTLSLSLQQSVERDSPWTCWYWAGSKGRALKTLIIINFCTNCLILHHRWCIGKFITEAKKKFTVLSTATWMLVVLL